jgi:hypothetical protein
VNEIHEYEIKARHVDHGTFTKKVKARDSAKALERAIDQLCTELDCEEEEIGVLVVRELGVMA